MREKVKPLYWINIGICFLSCIMFFLTNIEMRDKQTIQDVIGLCIAFLLVSLVCTGMYYYRKLFYCEYTEQEIALCWGAWTYNHISYNAVRGITIRGASDRTFYPIRDDDKKHRAVVSVYSSEDSFMSHMSSDSQCIIPSNESKRLCYSYFCKEDLSRLLDKTDVKVYITEEMMKVHNQVLIDLCEAYSDRVKIVCSNRAESFSKTTNLEDFIENRLQK